MSPLRTLALVWLFCIAMAAPAAARGETSFPFFAKFQGALPKEWSDTAFAIRLAWAQEKFDDLELTLSASGGSNAAGDTKQGVAYRVLEEISHSYYNGKHPSQSRVWPMLERWKQKFPKSTNPDVVRAMMLLRYAILTPEEQEQAKFPAPGYKPKESALKEAAELLARIGEADRPTHWVTESLKVKIAQGVPVEDLFVFVDTWSRTFPDNIEAKFVLVDHVIGDLRWHPENIEAMVRSLADDGKGHIDAVTYARIYLHTFDSQYGVDLFRASLGKWAYLRAGLKELAVKWPGAWVQNHQAAAACLAGDYPVAKAAFAMLGGPPERKIWRIASFYEDCRSWVQGKGVK